MTPERRIYDFPGGFLETNSYGDEDDGTGVYLESFIAGHHDDDERPEARNAL